MKIQYNPPIEPWLEIVNSEEPELEIITCPQCGSDKVYSHVLVTGYAFVNVNTFDVDESPDDCEASSTEDVRDGEYSCFNCSHEWVEEEERVNPVKVPEGWDLILPHND